MDDFPVGLLIVYLLLIVLIVASWWKLFEKAGQPGWAAIVPIYNLVVLLKIIDKPIWWLIMFLIPLVNIIFLVLLYVELAKKFGKDVGFAIGLLLLGIVFLPILAFGDAEYQGDASMATV